MSDQDLSLAQAESGKKRKKRVNLRKTDGAKTPSRAAQDLVNELTTSVGTELDPDLTRRLKQLAKSSDEAIKAIFEAVMAKVRTMHSQVRLLSLLVIDTLVMRSRVFRAIAVASIPTLLPFLLGVGPNSSLPPPAKRAALLKETALECLQRWVISFGAHRQYVQLILAKRYIETSLRLKLPNLRARASAREREALARRETTQRLLAEKFEQLKIELPAGKEEILSCLEEVDRSLGLVEEHTEKSSEEEADDAPGNVLESEEGRFTEFRDGSLERAVDCDEVGSGGGYSSRRREALEAVSLQHKMAVLAEKQAALPAVFRALREQWTLIEKKWLPMATGWITTLSRFDAVERVRVDERDSLLKEAIDLRNALRDALERCSGAGVNEGELDCEEADGAEGAGDGKGPVSGEGGEEGEGVEWETEVPVEEEQADGGSNKGSAKRNALVKNERSETDKRELLLRDPTVRVQKNPQKEGLDFARESSKLKAPRAQLATEHIAAGNDVENSGEQQQEKRAKREELLKAAPVVSWGMHLEYWGAGSVPAHHMALSCTNHWGAVDEEVCLPQERIQEMTLMCTTYRASARGTTASSAGQGPQKGAKEKGGETEGQGGGRRDAAANTGEPRELEPGNKASSGDVGRKQAPSPAQSLGGHAWPVRGMLLEADPARREANESSQGDHEGGAGGFLIDGGADSALLKAAARQAIRNVRRAESKPVKEKPGQGAGVSSSRSWGASKAQGGGKGVPSRHGVDNARIATRGRGCGAASIREHNDKVLRLAAQLDGTSTGEQGAGAGPGMPVGSDVSRLPTPAAQLKAMLQSPSSARQRLEKRAEKKWRKGL